MDRDSFLSTFTTTTPKSKDVPLDDGRVVKVRKLSQAEVETLGNTYANKTIAGLRFVVCKTMVNDEGKRVFEDKDMDRIAAIDFDVVNQIATAASEFSGLNVAKNQ